MIEDLNKTQIILLCLLASFVTSIGTGIITTSLLREAPQNVTQTINRVVERTVQTIVPEQGSSGSSGTPTVKEVTTVVVKEEELVIDAISKSRSSLVHLSKDISGSRDQTNVQSVGVIINKDGTILADKRYVTSGTYTAVSFATGDSYPVVISKTVDKSNFVFLVPSKNAPVKNYIPETVGNSDTVQLGQTVIAMGGKDKEGVAIGRINSVDFGSSGAVSRTTATTTATTKTVSEIETDTPLRDSISGSILLNLNGEMVGFENYDASRMLETSYIPISQIRRDNPTFFSTTAN